LTEKGLLQCRDLAVKLKDMPLVAETGLVVVSPMRRTLQTLQASLGWLIDQGIPVIVDPDWTETSMNNCDIGSPIGDLISEFPNFNYEKVYPEWPRKFGRYEHTNVAVKERGFDCREWLKSRPEKVIIAVSHADFLREGICSTIFANATARVFDFAGSGNQLIEQASIKDGSGPTRRTSYS
jgi:broad specificity phosphatase PhoE